MGTWECGGKIQCKTNCWSWTTLESHNLQDWYNHTTLVITENDRVTAFVLLISKVFIIFERNSKIVILLGSANLRMMSQLRTVVDNIRWIPHLHSSFMHVERNHKNWVLPARILTQTKLEGRGKVIILYILQALVIWFYLVWGEWQYDLIKN